MKSNSDFRGSKILISFWNGKLLLDCGLIIIFTFRILNYYPHFFHVCRLQRQAEIKNTTWKGTIICPTAEQQK